MNTDTKKRIGGIVLVGAALSYMFFSPSSKPVHIYAQNQSESPKPDSLTVSGEQIGDGSAEFLGALTAIKNIKIDTRIFTTDSFRSLNNYTVTVLSENNNGRSNPFASIGQEGGAFPLYKDSAAVEILDQAGIVSPIETENTGEKIADPLYQPGSGENAVDALSPASPDPKKEIIKKKSNKNLR